MTTNRRFSFSSLFSDFESREIAAEELESIIKDTVLREHPGDTIKELQYTEDGIEIVMDSGEEIAIDVDWNEIILS